MGNAMTVFETVQMADGSFCLCALEARMVNGEVRLGRILREVGVRRDAQGNETGGTK